MNDGFDFDKQLFFDYLKNNNISKDELIYLIRLYKVYSLVEKITNKKGEQILQYYERKIYTIDGKTMSDVKKVQLELYNIEKSLKIKSNDIDKFDLDFINYMLADLKNILLLEKNIDKELIEYMKKQISIIQAKIGLSNTFFSATRDAFLEEYRNININFYFNKYNNKYNYTQIDEIKYNDNNLKKKK